MELLNGRFVMLEDRNRHELQTDERLFPDSGTIRRTPEPYPPPLNYYRLHFRAERSIPSDIAMLAIVKELYESEISEFHPRTGNGIGIELFFLHNVCLSFVVCVQKPLLRHCFNCFVFCLSLFPPCKDIRPFRC